MLHADSVFRRGRIHTLDPAQPHAQALACRAGKIVAVGRDDDLQGLIGPGPQVVDLGDTRLELPFERVDTATETVGERLRLHLEPTVGRRVSLCR